MAREAIKLGVEKHGDKIRYFRMVDGHRFKSTVFESETRENKREAWQQFIAWRAVLGPKQPKPQPVDNYTLIREVLTEKVFNLVEHAELTEDRKGAQTFRALLPDIPTMKPALLQQLTALLLGEHGGIDRSAVVEDRERTLHRMKDAANPHLETGRLVEETVQRLKKAAENGRGSWGHHGQVKAALNLFAEWFGRTKSMELLSEKTVREFTTHLESLVDDGKIGTNTAHGYQAKWKTWVEQLIENYPEISLPRNLRSKSKRLPKERIEPNPFTPGEVKLLLEHSVDRTKLFILLFLNCGMYQGDVASLTHEEVDWENGRIIRERDKLKRLRMTTGKGTPFKHNWKLWPETWRLFQLLANREGLCFLSERGQPLIQHTESSRNDALRSAYFRTTAKLKRLGLIHPKWNKTIKQFRKTVANLLEKGPKEYGAAYAMYLNHSIAKDHYLVSGEPVPSFDEANDWVGRQFGADKPSK